MPWTPPFTTCVIRKSTTTEAKARCLFAFQSIQALPSGRAYRRAQSSSPHADLRASPSTTHPAGVLARGMVNCKSGSKKKVSSTRSMGHSIATPATSPSACSACPSPTENKPPSTGSAIQGAANDKFFAIEVPAAKARRTCGMHTRLVRAACPFAP